jgi:hypothetical protein
MKALINLLRTLIRREAVEQTRVQEAPAPTSTVTGIRENQALQSEPNDNVSRIPGPSTKKPGFTVDDVIEKGTDLIKNQILCVYSKVPPQYAVYLTKNRVVVQYADDPKSADEQRKKMATLNGLRTQIDGLVYGWRTSRIEGYRLKAKKYDIRVAAALVLCLEGDDATARTALVDIKEDISSERTSWGRFEYLIAALIASTGAIVLFFCVQRQLLPFKLPPGDLWLATRAGTIGAFFSIALAIQGRTVLTNLRRRDNIADATLRIAIGTIAAGVLLLLMQSGTLPKVQIGDGVVLGQSLQWQAVLIVGFIAGFSERLVPDLLAKGVNKESNGSKSNPPISQIGSGNSVAQN